MQRYLQDVADKTLSQNLKILDQLCVWGLKHRPKSVPMSR